MHTLALLLLQTTAPDRGLLFASDKIYTVLTIALVILGGVFGLLLHLNRRVSKLEQHSKQN